MEQFTETDIQDYVDGNFSGDRVALLRFLENDAEAALQLRLYRALKLALKEEPGLFVPGLADKVLAKIEERKTAAEPRWTSAGILVLVLLGFCALGFYFSYTGLKDWMRLFEGGVMVLLVLVGIAFTIAFHFMELMVLKKKFAL
jgi:anti-sigma factor RsiW